MKIEQVCGTNSEDYSNVLKIIINDKTASEFFDGEPEDNSTYRNFSDIYGIVDMLKLAHEAGKNGEELTIEKKELEWDEACEYGE